MFLEKHRVYGNKWSEIGKFLNGRNDNAVKNYFYSSVRKIIRKISLKKVTFDSRDSEVEKEVTIYLTEYILEMYRDYITLKRMKHDENFRFKIENGNLTQEQDMDVDNEESKDDAGKKLKAGDKYVIRKLISLQITPESMQEYVNTLRSGGTSVHMTRTNIYAQNMYSNNMNLQVPMHSNVHHRSNSQYNVNPSMQYTPVMNYGMVDDSQLINNYNQINLMNQNQYFTNYQNTLEEYSVPMQNINQQFANINFGDTRSDASLDNNLSIDNGPISSLPLYMRKMRPIRSQSINRTSQGSRYMNEAFLFDKIEAHNSKDDNSLQNDQHPIAIDNIDPKMFMPRVIKNTMSDGDNLSSCGNSSQSSFYSSFNDAGSM